MEPPDSPQLRQRKWTYTAYFDGVKAQIRKQWDPNERLRHFDPTGAQYAGCDWQTILSLTLAADGRLVSTQIQESSGLAFLDAAAIEAVERAAPFDAPPSPLVQKRGTVTFPFGFWLKAENVAGQTLPKCRAGPSPEAAAMVDGGVP